MIDLNKIMTIIGNKIPNKNESKSVFIVLKVVDAINTLDQFIPDSYCNIIQLNLEIATIYELQRGISETRCYTIEFSPDRKMCIKSKKIHPCISRGNKLLFPEDFEPVYEIEELREKIRWVFDQLRWVESKVPLVFKYPAITYKDYVIEVDRSKYWPNGLYNKIWLS